MINLLCICICGCSAGEPGGLILGFLCYCDLGWNLWQFPFFLSGFDQTYLCDFVKRN